MTKTALLCAALLVLTPRLHAATWAFNPTAIDPTATWLVLETQHFEIIYDQNQKALAQEYANEAERAETLLQPILKIPLPYKIPIVIADITDDSNGSASGIPRPTVVIYPVMPTVSDATSEYANWTREVVTHEYTHILAFEPTSGFMDILRSVYGSIFKPNMLLPRWYHEGLAVEMESRLTPVGRGRSHYYNALIRSQVDDGSWGKDTIDRVNATSIPQWPRGQRPYTYGYFLMHELGELPNKTGSSESIYSLLNHRYGHRFPWFINGPVEDYFGLDYEKLLAKTYETLGTKASAQISQLKNHGAKNGTPLMQSGYFNFGAQISPDKLKMAAIVSDYDQDHEIRIWIRNSTSVLFSDSSVQSRAITTAEGIHQLSWRSDSKHLIYDHSDTVEHFKSFNDLYEINTETEKEKRLTHGLRAREATVLSNGSLVFIAATPSNTRLVHAEKDGENPKVILDPPRGHRLSSPRAFQDGVIYSHRDDQGHEWIEALSLTTLKTRQLTHADRIGVIHVGPITDPETPGGFYFAGSDTGVLNIYRGIEGKWAPIINVTSYATLPEIDIATKNIIYSRLTGEGFKLETSPLTKAEPETMGSMLTYPKADESQAPKATITDEHHYHGVKYLFPQYWIPFFYFIPGGAVFDAAFAGSDPLGHHDYSVEVGYDTGAAKAREEVVYTNQSLPFMIDGAFANDYVYLVGAGQVEHVTQGFLGSRHFLFPNSNDWQIGPRLQYKQTELPGSLYTEFGPGAALAYDDVTPAKDFQISPEEGKSFSLGYYYFLPQWGNTSYQNINATAAVFYGGKPLPKHHAVALKTSAWVSPPQNTIFTGSQQAGGEYPGNLLGSLYMVRGYPVGEFVGSTVITGNFEYRFPIGYPYRGYGTFPLFTDRWHGALLCDAATLQGGYYAKDTRPSSALTPTTLGTYFMGTGLEARADTHVFYHLPLTFRFGLYYGFNDKALGGLTYFIGLGSVR